jgi:hypothetical protein
MICNTILGVAKDCENNIGGLIKEVIFFDMDDIDTLTENSTTWNIDALTLTTTAVSFALTKDTSNYEEVLANELNTRNTNVTTTVNLIMNRRAALKSKAIQTLAEGVRFLGGVVRDGNNTYWLLKDLQITEVGGGSGTTRTEGSQYNITMVGETDTTAKTVSEAIALALLVPVS